MGQHVLEVLASCLRLPENLRIAGISPTTTCLEVQVACQDLAAACPLCQQLSERVHSSYARTIADVPCGGRRVVLYLTVRKFVCGMATCPRKIFTERVPELVQPYARMTNRLNAVLQSIGLAAGGETGTRLSATLGIHTTPPTLLCHLMRLPQLPKPHVRVLGIDDWSWKKRHRYGTVLVDLELRKIIDVLPDRKTATVISWLREHPEVEIISRDRGTEYAAAAREGAPQAKQIVDRFHLVKNLAEVLEAILARCRAEVRREAQQELSEHFQAQEKLTPALPTPTAWQQRTPPQVGRLHQARQAGRDDRFRQVADLRAQGLKQREIAERVGMSERGVRNWLKKGAAPTCDKPPRRSVFDPYAAYVLERWQQGERCGKQLFEEIRAQGFKGSIRVVTRFLQALKADPSEVAPLPAPRPAERFSANALTWLFIRETKDLTAEERIEVFLSCYQSSTIQRTYLLVQAFLTMVRERRGYEFEGWTDAVEKCELPELIRFSHNLLKDREAVEAGLTYSYSNGPVEAQVHKLKLIKRQGFGRAKLPLLKQRLIHTL